MYITRSIEPVLVDMAKTFKVLLVTGARQVGKSTTLEHLFAHEGYEYVTLDDVIELEIAQRDPKAFFLNHPGKLIIDEVQYAPALFREIKFRVDKKSEYGQYILTGSQTFSLMSGITESLAGRVGIVQLSGLSLTEILHKNYRGPFIPTDAYLKQNTSFTSTSNIWEHIFRGSLPELTKNPDIPSNRYYASYVSAYIERDVRTITNVKDLGLFAQFVRVLAARVSQLLNYTEIAKELSVDSKTVKSWISILEASGIIVLVYPFSNNRLTRIIKSPVLYFMDTGLVAYLLNWTSSETLMKGPMSGAIFQCFAVSEIIKSFYNAGIINPPISFYRDKDQNEIDLIIESSGILYPIEIKQTTSPNPKMSKHFKLLEKAEGFTVGNEIILCQVEKRRYLTENLIALPISML